MLLRLRQIGANTVSTYVPWVWHAPDPATIDLTGATHSQRDLVGFVCLAAALGLRAILKPGPFVDAELLGGGIPPWLLAAHPEIAALRPDGAPWLHSDSATPRACYLHPAYLAAARGWIAAFSAAALPLQAPVGPVVALQADNETPGDGMLPADVGLDARLRLDYNPGWALRDGRSSAEAPHGWDPPQTMADLRRYAALDTLTDAYYSEAVATVAGWLAEDGWTIPLFHNLLAAPWDAAGTIADLPGLARATGWLGYNVYAEDVRAPFVGGGGYRLSFEEYVHFHHWRPRLVKSLSPQRPVFVPEISAAQDFYFAAPLMGGAQALNIYALHQTPREAPAVGALPRWAMEAPVRPDGGVRRRFWNGKTIYTLLGAAGADFAAAAQPATIAIGYSHVPERVGGWGYRPDYLRQGRAWEPDAPDLALASAGADTGTQTQLLAQRLVRAGISFDVVDLDAADGATLAGYALLLLPGCGVMALATQQKLAALDGLAVLGEAVPQLDERLEPCGILTAALARRDGWQLPGSASAAALGELAEARGGTARYAWADELEVDVAVRHGAHYTYLFVANRRSETYSGTLTYRSAAGDVLHVQIGLGARRVGCVLLEDEEVVGAACGGDAAESGWLARGMHSSAVFSGGAGVVVPCGAGALVSAAQSGRFQLRRPSGWGELVAYRLTLHGALLDAGFQVEGTHLVVPYVAEDERGATDCVAVFDPAEPLPQQFAAMLRALCVARAAALCRAALAASPADLYGDLGAPQRQLAQVAAELNELNELTPASYRNAWSASEAACDLASGALVNLIRRARNDLLTPAASRAIGDQALQAAERAATAVVELVARATLSNDRE